MLYLQMLSISQFYKNVKTLSLFQPTYPMTPYWPTPRPKLETWARNMTEAVMKRALPLALRVTLIGTVRLERRVSQP